MKKIFMLMIIFLQLLLTTTMTKQIKAMASAEDVTKPLVCLKGKNYQSFLEYDGYTIQSSNVNYNSEGKYSVNYQKNDSEEVLQKDVYVKTAEELTEKISFNENYQKILSLAENETIDKMIKYKDAYYIATSIKTDDKIIKPTLIKMENSQISFKVKVFNEVDGSIKDILVNDKEIVLIGSTTMDGYAQEILLEVYDHSGKRLHYERYIGESRDIPFKLIEDDQYYYLIAETYSKKYNYEFEHTYKCIAVFAIKKANYFTTSKKYLAVDNTLDIIDAITNQGKVVLLTRYFDKTFRMKLYETYVLEAGTLKDSTKGHFTYTITEEPFKMLLDDKQQILVITTEYSGGEHFIKMYRLLSNYSREEIASYYYHENANATLVDARLTQTNEIILLYNLTSLEDDRSDDPYGYLYRIIKNGQIQNELESYQSHSFIKELVSPNELLFEEDGNLIINTLNYLNIPDLKLQTKIKNAQDIVYPTLTINGITKTIDHQKSQINYDCSIFGEYDEFYYFSTDKLDVVTYGIIEVLPKINVCENEVYDNNFVLEFNGKATLNNYQITPNYLITKTGQYKLIVKGTKDAQLEINFTVEKLSCNDELLNEKAPAITGEDDNYSTTYQDIKVNNYIKGDDLKANKSQTNGWFFIIPACASILLVMAIIKKRG